MLATFPNWLIADANLHEMSVDSFVNCYLHGHLNTTPADYRAEQLAKYRTAAQVKPSLSLFPDPTTPDDVRLQANIWTRALSLFHEAGYAWEAIDDHCTQFYVFTPACFKSYRVDLLNGKCTCTCFAQHGDCKHRLGLARLFAEHVRQYAIRQVQKYMQD